MERNVSGYRKRQRIVCLDGFSMSVQADSSMYCSPREDGIDTKYIQVEIGYPSEEDVLLNEYVEGTSNSRLDVENAESYTESVYPWVPAEVVKEVIDKHGGMIGGELPLLDLTTELVFSKKGDH